MTTLTNTPGYVEYGGTEHHFTANYLMKAVHDRGYHCCQDEDWTTAETTFPDELLQNAILIKKYTFQLIGVFDFENRAVFKVQIQYTSVDVTVFSKSLKDCAEAIEYLRGLLPETEPTEDAVSVNFWTNSMDGPANYEREIVVPEWGEIRANYPGEVGEELDWLMTRKSGDDLRDGRLILWRGEPGTGKTFALRALGQEWRKWCDLHYITDPEAFFGQSSYMMSVMLREAQQNRWNLLVLEDSGELLHPEAKQNTGQGLSRLLNVVDGMLGQGMQFLVLVTTNEDIGKLHPAVSRPGRCASTLEFKPFKYTEAREWLENHGNDDYEDVGESTLSELFAKLSNERLPKQERKPVGFAV